MRRVWRVVKESVLLFFEDDAMTRGAAIAYYAIFSVAPILVIAVAIAGYVFGAEAAQKAAGSHGRALAPSSRSYRKR